MSEERLTLAAEPRTVVGKKVKRLRRDNIVPAVIYGQQEPMNIQIERGHLRRVLRQAGTSQLVDINVEGNKELLTVLAREIQQHKTRGDVLHVDFFEVDMQSTITTEATLMLVGESPEALLSMGSVVLASQSIEIECLPADLISEVEVDVTGIESPDDVIYVSDLSLPKSITVLTDPETVAARFQYAQLEEEEEEAEELEEVSVDDVEVIEKGKAEDEEEGEL